MKRKKYNIIDKKITRAARLGCLAGGLSVGVATGNFFAAEMGCLGGAIAAKIYERKKLLRGRKKNGSV